MTNLNNLELAVLHRLSTLLPGIEQHIPLLEVSERELTGVGMYINFCYTRPEEVPSNIGTDGYFTTNETIDVPGLTYGVGYEVSIEGGLIRFIEFVTYGEEWDGAMANFRFVDNDCK